MTSGAPVAESRAVVPGPIDWALAGRVARRAVGRDPLARSYLTASLADDFAEVSARAEALVADFTGLVAPAPARARVLDRTGWVEANLRSLRTLLAPLTDRIGARAARHPLAPVGRSVTATEVGLLLGWLSQRVLGQYDLLVPADDHPDAPATDDAVYYVGENVLSLEKRFAFRPRDFRLWIALHECTHRAQFTAVPWLRPYFLEQVGDLLGGVDADPRRVVDALRTVLEELRRGRNPLDDGGLVTLLATPGHREALGRIQSLMTVLEGHGNRVMNELGARHVHGQDRMARVLESRRSSRGASALLRRAMGVEAKMRQYEVGERFVAEVECRGGDRALDPVWRGPEWIPTADELAEPERWLERVA